MTSNTLDTILRQDFAPQSDDDWQALDSVAQHFFRPTAPIDEDRLFAGRIKQLTDLLGVIYQAGAHAIIYGERGVGKTSLANIIHQRVIGPSRFTKVLKIGCSPNDRIETIWGNVFFDYLYDGRQVVEVVKQHPQPFTIYKIAESICQENTRYLIILDEFDRISNEEAKILIADTIKYLSDNPIRVTVLVVGVGSSIETLFGSHPSIQRCCQQIPMPRMSRDELTQIIQDRLPPIHMSMNQGVLDRMVEYSQGLPGICICLDF